MWPPGPRLRRSHTRADWRPHDATRTSDLSNLACVAGRLQGAAADYLRCRTNFRHWITTKPNCVPCFETDKPKGLKRHKSPRSAPENHSNEPRSSDIAGKAAPTPAQTAPIGRQSASNAAWERPVPESHSGSSTTDSAGPCGVPNSQTLSRASVAKRSARAWISTAPHWSAARMSSRS